MFRRNTLYVATIFKVKRLPWSSVRTGLHFILYDDHFLAKLKCPERDDDHFWAKVKRPGRSDDHFQAKVKKPREDDDHFLAKVKNP